MAFFLGGGGGEINLFPSLAKQVFSCSMSKKNKSENINTNIVFINIHSIRKKRSEESSEMYTGQD